MYSQKGVIYYGARRLSLLHANPLSLCLDDPVVKVIVILDFDPPGIELINREDTVLSWHFAEAESKLVFSGDPLSFKIVILPRFLRSLEQKGGIVDSSTQLDFRGNPLHAWLYLLTRNDGAKVLVTREIVAEDAALADGYYRLSHLTPNETETIQKATAAE
jgi:hypothetical protein